jgi:hypothetical protein
VVIDDFDIVCSLSFDPAKTDPPLIVDTNAVLTLAVAFERFEAVSRLQIGQRLGGSKALKARVSRLFDSAKALDETTLENSRVSLSLKS